MWGRCACDSKNTAIRSLIGKNAILSANPSDAKAAPPDGNVRNGDRHRKVYNFEFPIHTPNSSKSLIEPWSRAIGAGQSVIRINSIRRNAQCDERSLLCAEVLFVSRAASVADKCRCHAEICTLKGG